jgi:putative phosphoesterase
MPIRIAILSDIHGNRRAFDAVLADLHEQAPDLVVQGGDLAYGGAHPAHIIDQIRALGWPGVRGNTDEMLWSPASLESFAAATPKLNPLLSRIRDLIPPTLAIIGEGRLHWLETLPTRYTDNAFTLVHAGPHDLWRSPMANATDDELRTTYAPLHARTVVYGHIHVPFVRTTAGLTVANTGSVGQSYDGDTRASYLLLDGENISVRRVEYDVETEAKELAASGLPHANWLATILLAGKYVSPG